MSRTLRFRKRPVEVEAVQWWINGDHPDDGPGGSEGFLHEGKVVRYFEATYEAVTP